MTSTADSRIALTSWSDFRAANRRIRIRDAAKLLGTTEAELLATGIGNEVTRLTVENRATGWGEIIERMPSLGRVMALTRNEHCVHERRGQFREIGFFGSMGNVVGHDIDLRFFLNAWAFGFAVTEPLKDGGTKRSLQFFDAAGTAIHKVFLEEEGDIAAFENIVEEFRMAGEDVALSTTPKEPKKTDQPDSAIDAAGFRAALEALQDTHDFFGLLRKFGLGRVQALRLAGDRFASRLAPTVAEPLLRAAAERALPIMVFVGNHGMIQIHTGEVQKIVPFGENAEWINVLDSEFNLHLMQPGVHEAWVARKPTRDGHVTSVELFDAEGELVVQFFGKRKPGESELEEWRALAADLQTSHPAVR